MWQQSANHSLSLRWAYKTAPWEFQTQPLHYFFTSNNKSNLHFTPQADFAVINGQLWSTMTAIFPWVNIFAFNCYLRARSWDYCQIFKTSDLFLLNAGLFPFSLSEMLWDTRWNMGQYLNSGGWYFYKIIDVENPSNALDILKNTSWSPMSKSCVLLRFVDCSSLFIVEIIDNVWVRMLLLFQIPDIFRIFFQSPTTSFTTGDPTSQ